MQTMQGNMLQSLRAVRSFVDAHADKLGNVVDSGARRKLDDAIRELASHHAAQKGSDIASRSSTQRQQQLRRILMRDHIVPIARIAAADLPATTDMRPFRVPRGRMTLEKLVGFAQGMAEQAPKFIDVFIEAGQPADFIEQLSAAADALLAEIDGRNRSRGRRAGATVGLQEKLANGRKIVEILDSFVKRALKGDKLLLADWESSKRVQRVTAQRSDAAPKPALTGPAAAPFLPPAL